MPKTAKAKRRAALEAQRLAALEEKVAALRATVAGIGHNRGPPIAEPVLLPDRAVADRYACTVRTLERWDEDPKLEFPRPVYIRRRQFRDLEELKTWERSAAHSPNPSQLIAQTLPRAKRGRWVGRKAESAEA